MQMLRASLSEKSGLCRKPVYMYVLNFNDRVFFLHILSDDCKVLCAVLFSVNIILRTTLEISVR